MNESEIQFRQLERILAISHQLIANCPFDDILHQIVQLGTELVDCETVSILLLDEQSKTLRFVAAALYQDRIFSIPVPIDSSIAGAAFTGDRPIIVPNVEVDPRYYRPVAELLNYPAHSLLAVPLKFQDRKIGALEAENKKNAQCFDETDARVLTALATQATLALENARLYRQAQQEIAARLKIEEELRRHQDHLEELVQARTAEVHRLAITDPLTNIFNRRHLMLLGNQALKHAHRYRQPLAAMMIDLDHFKQINDLYGHALGDQVLKEFADVLRHQLRDVDILGRYGGEEFVVFMPETNLDAACAVAERLLTAVRVLQIRTDGGEIRMTVSIGVTMLDHAEHADIDALVQHADRAMYAAKQAGRDCLVARL